MKAVLATAVAAVGLFAAEVHGAVFATSSRTITARAEDAKDLQDAFEVLPRENQTGWLGGDSDVSMVIRGGRTGRRVLWIFADTFIGHYNAKTRAREATDWAMPSSSVALAECESENGPCAGTPHFFWRQDDQNRKLPFFGLPANRTDKGELLWAVAGIAARDGRSVLLLAQRIQRPLTVLGSTAIVIRGVDTEDDPRKWNYTTYDVEDHDLTWFSGITFAGSSGDEVYIFGHEHSGGPRSFLWRGRPRSTKERWSRTLLARAPLSSLLAHDWGAAEYWIEPGVWAPAQTPEARKEVKRIDLPSWETTCTWSEDLGLWYAFNTEGPGIAMWVAEEVTGPWERSGELYHLPRPFVENSTWLCYAAKAHPELSHSGGQVAPGSDGLPYLLQGATELVFSWICNSNGDFATMAHELFQPGGMDLPVRGYWPRFVRVAVSPHTIMIA